MNFKINQTRTTFETVELSEEGLKNAIKAYFNFKYKIPEDSFLKDGKIVRNERTGGGSHSWFEEVVIKENPTEAELAVLQILKDNK